MKNNINESFDLLNKAYKLLPDKDVYQDARNNIRSAINKIEHIQNKKETKLNQQRNMAEEWKDSIKNMSNSFVSTQTLSVIESMLGSEYKKLKGLKDKNDNELKLVPMPNGESDIQDLHD